MLFLEIEPRQFKAPYYQEVAKSMELVLKRLTSESRSGNPVQLSGRQESSRVEEISQRSEVVRQFSQFRNNSGGKSIN